MARGTLGTGMMAPLSMANNFNGPYYAGPSGAAMGALMASQAIADGFRDWGESKGRQQEEARVQAEMDRKRMDELNQRSAVYQALNPGVQMQSANGMSNRDMDRKMAMPDAGTQISLYKFAEDKRKEAQAQELEKKKNFANAYFAQGGHRVDPTGEKFAARFGYNPYEIGDTGIIARMEEKEAQRQWQEDMKREGHAQAQILAGMRGGGSSRMKPPSGYRVVVDENGEERLDFIPGGPADPSNKPDNSRSIPTAAVASLTGNFSTINRIDESLSEIDKAPYATNYLKGAINEYAPNLVNRVDPDGAQARAAIGDLGSTVIHDRSGAAVTASEYPRLRPFIPTAYDDADTVKMKLNRFKQIVEEETRLYADNFSPEMGYRRPESWGKYLDAQPVAEKPAANKGNAPSGGRVIKFDANGNQVVE